MALDPREVRGLAIVARGNQIRRIDASTYKVKSQNGNGWYTVRKIGGRWTCTCPDFTYRRVKCKHIWLRKILFIGPAEPGPGGRIGGGGRGDRGDKAAEEPVLHG